MTQVNQSMANPKGNLDTLKPFQGKWRSGQTRTIRVPVTLAEQVLDYALKLDAAESLTQVNHKETTQRVEIGCESLTQVIQILNDALTLKANAGGKIKDRIRDALSLLE
jgi:hypothetical protein